MMSGFETLTSPVLHLDEDRIDTDVIFPARFLLLMQREGLGDYFCRDRRVDAQERPLPNPIDEAAAVGVRILLAGEDFGCGSSREQAVWALRSFGIRCVMAPSFGEIFQANCLRNGVLALKLTPAEVETVAAMVAQGPLTVSLEEQTIAGAGGETLAFAIAPAARERLLNDWDETAVIENRWGAAIDRFEADQRLAQPWLYA